MKKITANLNGEGKKIALVVSRFNEFISQRLLDGAIDTLLRHNVADDNITVVWVPGSFEIPQAAKTLAQTQNLDAIICLGAVIRGSTPHFDYIAAEVSKGIAQLNISGQVPIIFGVITTDNLEQAIERAGSKMGNKGAEAACTAIEMANLNAILAQE